ncbi:MAG TPA: 4Fe-4S dicluster domain-containing protein [candidate division Zixibacteria bacterium]|nr:4Fe-4S dicluster domain-containing protein [candidate division Zixibacteria bacterium]
MPNNSKDKKLSLEIKMDESKTGLNRRKFLASSISCAMAAGVISLCPGIAGAQDALEKKSDKERKMIYRGFGKTGWKIPIISMGVMRVPDPGIIKAAFEAGIRHFDTAANYQYGRNEQMVGNVLAKLGVRKQVIIGSKILVPAQREALTEQDAGQRINQLIDATLKRIKSDYIDILYVHDVSDPSDVSNPLILNALKEAKQAGKVRAIGITTHSNMAMVINEMIDVGDYDAVLTAINFTMADDDELMAAIEKAAKSGMAVVAMKTLAGGANWPNPETRRNYNAQTVTRAALKWVMNNENIVTSIPGFTNYEHLTDDIEVAYDLDYTSDEKKLLKDNNIKLSIGFCRQCRQCLASCPYNSEVPKLMRIHMYAAQYANFYLARQTLDEIPESRGLEMCRDCDTCVAQCANSVDIAQKINDLKLMYT